MHIVNALSWQVTRMSEGTMEYAKEVGVIPQVIQSLSEAKWQDGVEGFMVTSDWQAIMQYIDQELPTMYYIDSEPGCIDIMPSGATKCNGVSTLARLLGIPQQDIIAIGNYFNDLDMIKYAGVGIAVANSLPEVKAEADYVTDNDNNHDAIAEVIERMFRGEYNLLPEEKGAEKSDKRLSVRN